MSFMAVTHAQDAGIKLNNECLVNGGCSLDIYQTLQIRRDVDESNTQILVQDVILSTTFFIGTLATVGLLISGFMMVFGGAKEDMYQKGVKGFKYSLIGLLLVVGSYSMIRLIQFIAQGSQ